MFSYTNNCSNESKRTRNSTVGQRNKQQRPLSSMSNAMDRPMSKNPMSQIDNKTVFNLYDKENQKGSKEMQRKLEAMRNRIGYIEREGQKNKAQMKIKKHKLEYLKETKMKASNWANQVNEAKKKQIEHQQQLKNRVSNLSVSKKKTISSIKQKMLEEKHKNYVKMKEEKLKLKKEREEKVKKELENKKISNKRKMSQRKSEIFMLDREFNNVNLYGRQKTTKSTTGDYFFKSKQKNELKRNADKEIEEEIKRLEEMEKDKLNKLQSILKEKNEIELDYMEVTAYKGQH